MVPFGEWKLAAGGRKSGLGYISQRPRISSDGLGFRV